MISYLEGKIVSKKASFVTILTSGGVGFKVNLPVPFFASLKIGAELKLETYLKVSENSFDLYGFANSNDKDFFELLLSVNGVGPKSALNILSIGNVNQIQNAILKGDVSYLTQVNGIGKKSAERIVVELKNKIKGIDIVGDDEGASQSGEVLSDVIDGLISMGYSAEEARRKVRSLPASTGKTTEQLLKLALKN